MVKKEDYFEKFKKECKKSWSFVKESKKFIYASLVIFVISALVGFFVPMPLEIQERLMEIIKELLETTEGMNALELIWFIFFNNASSSLYAIVFGVLLGIFPLMATIFNGYFVGFVSNMAISEAGILSLWRLLPHGIFELPAIFISFGLGIRVGFSIFFQKEFLKKNLIESLKVFAFIVVPLLIIAGIIEGFLISFLG